MRTPARQRGVALITALLVVAIATIAAVEMARRQQLDIRRLQNLLARDQAQTYAIAAETWALDILKTDLDQNRNLDHPGEDWAQPIAPPPFDGVKLLLEIDDLQGRFNVNNLAKVPDTDPLKNAHYKRFVDLLQSLRDTVEKPEDFPDIDPQQLANNLADWLDEDANPRYPVGAEDDVYSRKDQPYRPANQPMTSATELRLVEGFAEIYPYLEPYVTALPGETELNLNTAHPVLLRILRTTGGQPLSLEQAAELIKQRPPDGWKEKSEFYDSPLLSGVPVGDYLGVSSGYFRVTSTVAIGPVLVRMYSLVARDNTNGQMRVLHRSLGDL